MVRQILKPGRKYTFSDYYHLNYPTDEITQLFGYSFATGYCKRKPIGKYSTRYGSYM